MGRASGQYDDPAFKHFFPDMWGATKGISSKKALLFIVIAGAVVYYFAIHRRRK